jgi:trimethylguanosine synthase
VKVEPSLSAKKKTKATRLSDHPTSVYSRSSFDKNWHKRYFLFEKFDEGINLDEESWAMVIPEAVAEYIAVKCKCDTVLDGFCGAGGSSIKLANTCSWVIANDICKNKLRFLQNNAKVYSAENIEITNQDFLKFEGIEPDVVLLAPPFNPEKNLVFNCLDPANMDPPLDKVFAKAIKLSKNVAMLLPPNINVEKLGELIAKAYIDANIPSSSCSIKI